ncbi:hypothetical protein B0H13DRAFT_1899993 [Mycena leptocephala]|nr:hypothetical protein B0H13DRAFT_1899993 [Mycena leptocephala]
MYAEKFMWIDGDLGSECAVQIGDFGRKWAKIAQNGQLAGSDLDRDQNLNVAQDTHPILGGVHTAAALQSVDPVTLAFWKYSSQMIRRQVVLHANLLTNLASKASANDMRATLRFFLLFAAAAAVLWPLLRATFHAYKSTTVKHPSFGEGASHQIRRLAGLRVSSARQAPVTQASRAYVTHRLGGVTLRRSQDSCDLERWADVWMPSQQGEYSEVARYTPALQCVG